ncbi:MAG: thioredoxin family protein [Bacteroidales bacterium]
MVLQTNLKHITSKDQFDKLIKDKENVMVCCGRMGPMCIPVYQGMKKLEGEYGHVEFYDMSFDNPDAHVIKGLPECRGFMGLPFTVYFKNGEVAAATSSIQDEGQIRKILDEKFKD